MRCTTGSWASCGPRQKEAPFLIAEAHAVCPWDERWRFWDENFARSHPCECTPSSAIVGNCQRRSLRGFQGPLCQLPVVTPFCKTPCAETRAADLVIHHRRIQSELHRAGHTSLLWEPSVVSGATLRRPWSEWACQMVLTTLGGCSESRVVRQESLSCVVQVVQRFHEVALAACLELHICHRFLRRAPLLHGGNDYPRKLLITTLSPFGRFGFGAAENLSNTLAIFVDWFRVRGVP